MSAAVESGVLTVSAEAYHRDDLTEQPSLSASIATILCTNSPAHARAAHPRLNPNFERAEEEKFDIGTAAHALFLQGTNVVEILGYADWRTAAAKEARDLARAHGRIPLLAKQWEQVSMMVDAIRGQLERVDADPPLFTDGKPEQTLVWEEDGVWCRARLDWLRDDHRAICDLKTTSRSANPETWSRTLFGMGADVQAAMFVRGARKVLGCTPAFRWAVIENYPPFALSVVSLAPDAMALAERKVEHAVGVWRRCLASGEWPAYSPRVAWAQAPGWAEAQWLEREALDEVAEAAA